MGATTSAEGALQNHDFSENCYHLNPVAVIPGWRDTSLRVLPSFDPNRHNFARAKQSDCFFRQTTPTRPATNASFTPNTRFFP
jgi:hypothetical protein